ncbi:nitrilase-related carbon-nitrogen hydrolase [Clostridium sp.]|uniref:nitrilase-related carbon-nitrogen hydrolase n=1 Tax=Clostridium sp. TaxID=1506 RepID=UPI003217266F
MSGNNFSVWRSHLISRAAENQRFVISSNNANENQQCPTMLISPKGQVIAEVISSELDVIKRTIDTDDISDWYLDQCRSDVVKIISK